jgi:hypothetical protein
MAQRCEAGHRSHLFPSVCPCHAIRAGDVVVHERRIPTFAICRWLQRPHSAIVGTKLLAHRAGKEASGRVDSSLVQACFLGQDANSRCRDDKVLLFGGHESPLLLGKLAAMQQWLGQRARRDESEVVFDTRNELSASVHMPCLLYSR